MRRIRIMKLNSKTNNYDMNIDSADDITITITRKFYFHRGFLQYIIPPENEKLNTTIINSKRHNHTRKKRKRMDSLPF